MAARKIRSWHLLALTAALSAQCLADTNHWSDLAKDDVKAIEKLFSENHPGPVDRLNPGFADVLKVAAERAVKDAATVKSFDGYLYTLRRLTSSFNDDHIHLDPIVDRVKVNWPGFFVERRNGRLLVKSKGKSPSPNSELLSCDGKTPERLFRENVFPFRGVADLDSDWNLFAPSLFIDDSNPYIARPSRCMFRHDGKTDEIELKWTDIRKVAFAEERRKIVISDKPKFEVRSFGNRKTWISIPTYMANDAQVVAGLRKAEEAALKARSRADTVVLDLRGNGGGNSAWGERIVAALFGEPLAKWAQAKSTSSKPYVEWRVSEKNLAHWRDVLQAISSQFGADKAKSFDGFLRKFATALEKGEALLRTEGNYPLETPSRPMSQTKAKVYVLTDSSCFSACLDMLDLLKEINGVVQVGHATGGDTRYMDVAEFELPSGLAKLTIPLKVYRNRKRGDNEVYRPDVTWSGDITDTNAIEKWVLGLHKTN